MSQLPHTNETDSDPFVRAVIAERHATALDSFGVVQESFFGTCRKFAANPSPDQTWELEASTMALEFGLQETVRAIAANQACPKDKLRMAFGFVVAEDAMRIEVLRELAPSAIFHTYKDSGTVDSYDGDVRDSLITLGADTLIANIVFKTTTFLQSDVKCFAEVLTPDVTDPS